jgi:hypothetical protein
LPTSERDIRVGQSGNPEREGSVQKSRDNVRSDEKVRSEREENGFELRARETKDGKEPADGNEAIELEDKSRW